MQLQELLKKHPSLSYAAEMQELCKPLQALGITYFSHARINDNGILTGNASHPEFLAEYLRQGLYNFDLHIKQGEFKQRYILWDLLSRYGQTEELYQLGIEFGVCHTFSIVKAEANSTKSCYHFAVKPGLDYMNEFYIQHLDLLEKFIEYYNEQIELNARLNSAYEMHCHVSTDTGGFWVDKMHPVSPQSVAEFFKAIGCNEDSSSIIRPNIARREWQCAFYLLEGKTTKEIAKCLNISPRTVEVYIDRLKQRFNSKNKVHLARHLMEANILSNE